MLADAPLRYVFDLMVEIKEGSLDIKKEKLSRLFIVVPVV